MHSFEVEGVEKVKDDYILTIDILPNRAHDCLSHIGIAREAAAVTGLALKQIPSIVGKLPSSSKSLKNLEVKVEDINLCSRYTAMVMADVEVGPSPQWLRNYLEVLGMRPINNIVDAANFVMLETGQPLHAFDFDKLSGGDKKTLIVRSAKNGEPITTLDNQALLLPESALVIANEEGVLAVAGIKGGKKAEIDGGTHNIVLESANFDSASIRKTSRATGISTDASYRFEHTVPPAFALWALEQVADLITDIAKGKKGPILDTAPQNVRPRTVAMSEARMQSLLGADIKFAQAAETLKKLGFDVEKRNAQVLKVGVPVFRPDVELEADLIEEVGRIYGYENIKAQVPIAELALPPKNEEHDWEKIAKNNIRGIGAVEVYTYSFISDRQKAAWGYGDLIELENPMSAEFAYLRPSIVPHIVEAAEGNLRYFSSVRLFEIGKVFELPFKEHSALAMVIASRATQEPQFFELKGIVMAFLESLGISDVWFDDALKTKEESGVEFLHPARRAQIKVGPVDGSEVIGWIGEVHPRVLSDLKLKGEYGAAELDFYKIVKLAQEERVYTPPSKYPAVVRDIAVLVPRQSKVEWVIQKIEAIGGALVQDIDLFDMYEGEHLDNPTKSLAFHIVFQSDDRTLTSEEIDDIMAKIYYMVEGEGWEVRK